MKKIYVIAVTYPIEGLFAIVNSILDHTIAAKKKDYIPIVDLKHYYNQYFKSKRVFKDNAWEYFFEQPCGYSLNDIDEDSEVVISPNLQFTSDGDVIWNREVPTNKKNQSKNLIRRKNIYKNLLKFNPETQEYLIKNSFEILKNKEEVLGVLYRGTDYTKKRTRGEYIQPSLSEVIKKIKQTIKKYPKIKKIYLATEDDGIYKTFQKTFGDMLIPNNQYKYMYDKKDTRYLSEIKIMEENHNYNIARDYLLSIYILSKLKYFVGGLTTGSKWAWILSDDWKYFHIWNIGCYGKTLKERIFSRTTTIINSKKYTIIQILGLKFKIKLK